MTPWIAIQDVACCQIRRTTPLYFCNNQPYTSPFTRQPPLDPYRSQARDLKCPARPSSRDFPTKPEEAEYILPILDVCPPLPASRALVVIGCLAGEPQLRKLRRTV
ncbi:hypothetical protein P153DRAFT_391249 [Dothidotthia symphoricarpi CBS 119687]|uniref:Uncharacterized protein n=1 Tax=Dothidotthia symphoricarpi CBS 119687 TaxID=1392245 RepID=A0A6A5ZW54_9PLEO|nr:uncharacterized protein P153DRAFT_391249 [Dothidotthia symphoricarpi CBS 119687]KAF2123820.1 hypothetical protein P153DRAFT_391249 [Dothidotthia symphoricarpi CBS 119687]